MATLEQSLSTQEKELVAVGASVGAGCRPCVSHHLKAGANAGLDDGHLLAAVASAERVAAEAAVLMGDHVRGKLGADVTPALLSRVEETLASLGAALGANDKTNIERRLKDALGLGVSRDQLREAIETARVVQENAARIHVREAERLLDAVETAEPEPADEGCGCGAAGDETEPEPARDERPVAEPVSGPAGFAAMMEKCRGMAERPAPAVAATPAAAPERGDSCGEGC
jgi:AhpD family alkylhydroperoxidase